VTQTPATEEEQAKPANAGAVNPNPGSPTDAPREHEEPRSFEAPVTRPIAPHPEGEKVDHMAARESHAEDRQEALLDEALEETFPGSDPISPKHIT